MLLNNALVVELVDTADLKSAGVSRTGSSPVEGTKLKQLDYSPCGGMADTAVLGTAAFGRESSSLSGGTKQNRLTI